MTIKPENPEHLPLVGAAETDEIISVDIQGSRVFTLHIDGRLIRGPAWTTLDAAAVEFIERLGEIMPGYKLVKRTEGGTEKPRLRKWWEGLGP